MNVADTDALFDRAIRLGQLLPDIDDIDDPDDIDTDLLIMVAAEMNATVRLVLRALGQTNR
jgi:hypothetical protein